MFGRAVNYRDNSLYENNDKEVSKYPFYQSKIPWDLKLAHSLTYSNNKNQKKVQKKNVSIKDLQKKVWHYSQDLETHTVETHIYRLRKKMKDIFEDENFCLRGIVIS